MALIERKQFMFHIVILKGRFLYVIITCIFQVDGDTQI